MNLLTIILTMLFSSLVFSKTKLPKNLLELQKDSEDYVFVETTDSESGERLVYLGLQEGETTLFKTVLSPTPFLEWTALQKDGYKNFDLPVSELFVEERGSKKLYVLDTEGEIWFSSTGGVTFIKTGLEFSKEKSFEEQVLEFEASGNYFNFLVSSKNYTNQINDLPPMAQTVWDTILWDEPEILLTNVVTGSGTFMHGRVAADDSGYVHVLSVMEDGILRYHRSTDYGESFENAVIFADTMATALKIIATGDYVYAYGVHSIFASNAKTHIFVSSDKGVSWNPPVLIDFGEHIEFTARNDTLYNYIELSPNGVYESRSTDGGVTFSPYNLIGGPISGSIQFPSVTIGGNSIVYTRTGSSTSLIKVNAFRSFDLGNSWQPELMLTPTGVLGDNTHISYHINSFHSTEGSSYVIYTRSEDGGNTFLPHQMLCNPIQSCSAEPHQRNSSYGDGVFSMWSESLYYPEDRLHIRFSRDKGDNWSQMISTSHPDEYPGVTDNFSISATDSIVYTVFTEGIQDPVNVINLRLNLKRGFYKSPICDSYPYQIWTPETFVTQIDSSITITNKGKSPLVINQMEIPSGLSTVGLMQMPFTVLPDSNIKIDLTLTPNGAGVYLDTLRVHTNQPVNSIKEIYVYADIPTDLEEESNKIKSFTLSQNYPNTFKPTTSINYELEITNYENAKLTIYNILGEEVVSWQLNKNSSNYGKVVWDGTDSFNKPVSSGVYLYRLQVGNQSLTKKMMLLR